MNLGPFNDVIDSANRVIAAGGDVFQQFQCGHCGQKLTMDVPNTFYLVGTCDQCGKQTDIKAAGHSFMALFGGVTNATNEVPRG